MKKIFVLLTGLLLVSYSKAQIVEDPTRWKHEVVHLQDDLYEVVTTCTFSKKDWHVYSMKPGGDGTLIAPELSYTFGSGAKKEGSTTEHGKRITEDIKGVGTVHYFKNKVQYKQKFRASKDGTVKGSVYYQTCDDEMCLPPNEIDFSVKYKAAKTPVATEKKK